MLYLARELQSVAVLLVGDDGVELQWHRITGIGDMKGKPPLPKPDKPGAELSSRDHTCSFVERCSYFGRCPEGRRVDIWKGKKEFWEEQRRMESRSKSQQETSNSRSDDEDCKSEMKASYNSRHDYAWWPGKNTLLQSNVLKDRRIKLSHNSSISSDGSGMLVVMVEDTIQVWHVGTMALVRECHPLSGDDYLDFNEDMSIDNLIMHTAIHPIEDTLAPGEGSYYANDPKREVPDIKLSRQFVGSRNPVDLSRCDANTILARFGHLTYDEQRSFEKGECGRGGSGNTILRDNKMEEGSCSPQLNCIIRVAFTVCNSDNNISTNRHGSPWNLICHLDINPFHHIRHRESMQKAWDEEEEVEEGLQGYENVCLGKGSLWSDSTTYNYADAQSGYQSVLMLDWQRGGIFDFYGEDQLDRSRSEKMNKLIGDLIGNNSIEDLADHPEVAKLFRKYLQVQKDILRHRSISSLYVDSFKLIISTRYEIAILPLSLCLPELGRDHIKEDWLVNMDDEYNVYHCDTETSTWHCFRPVDDALIRRYGEIDFVPNVPWDPHRPNDAHTITEDLKEGLEQEHALMNAVLHPPYIDQSCLSWRYFATVSDSLCRNLPDFISSSPKDFERLHVFDSLADWREDILSEPGENEGGDSFVIAEAGLHFNGVYESSDDESSESSSWEESLSSEEKSPERSSSNPT